MGSSGFRRAIRKAGRRLSDASVAGSSTPTGSNRTRRLVSLNTVSRALRSRMIPRQTRRDHPISHILHALPLDPVRGPIPYRSTPMRPARPSSTARTPDGNPYPTATAQSESRRHRQPVRTSARSIVLAIVWNLTSGAETMVAGPAETPRWRAYAGREARWLRVAGRARVPHRQ